MDELAEAATVMAMDNAFDTKTKGLETLLLLLKHGKHHWADYDDGAKCALLHKILTFVRSFVHVKPSYGKSGKSGSKYGGSGGDYDYLWEKLGYLIDDKCQKFETTATVRSYFHNNLSVR